MGGFFKANDQLPRNIYPDYIFGTEIRSRRVWLVSCDSRRRLYSAESQEGQLHYRRPPNVHVLRKVAGPVRGRDKFDWGSRLPAGDQKE